MTQTSQFLSPNLAAGAREVGAMWQRLPKLAPTLTRRPQVRPASPARTATAPDLKSLSVALSRETVGERLAILLTVGIVAMAFTHTFKVAFDLVTRWENLNAWFGQIVL